MLFKILSITVADSFFFVRALLLLDLANFGAGVFVYYFSDTRLAIFRLSGEDLTLYPVFLRSNDIHCGFLSKFSFFLRLSPFESSCREILQLSIF